MPQHRIKAPDGNTYTVNAPEGATDEQIINYAKANYSKLTPAAAPVAAPKTLKANDTLGFLNGGSQVFNNILGAGSDALGALGVPASVRHGIGKVIRQGADVTGQINAATGTHLPELIPGSLPNKDQIKNLNQRAALQGQRPGKLGVAGGQIAATIPSVVASAALAPEAGATGGLAAVRGALAGRGIIGAGIQGAEQALQTSDKSDAAGLTGDALAGAGLGAGGNVLLRGAAGYLAPRFNGALQTVINMGARDFSPGQLLASLDRTPKGAVGEFVRGLEDASRSIPGSGAAVAATQQGAFQDAQRAYLQNAVNTANLPHTVAGHGHDLYSGVKTAFNGRYDALDNMVNLQHDARLAASPRTGAFIQDAVNGLEDSQGRPLGDRVADLFNPTGNHLRMQRGPNGFTPGRQAAPQLAGSDYKTVDQALRAQAKAALNPGAGLPVTSQMRAQATRYNVARKLLRDSLTDQQPDVASALNNTDTGYAMFKRAQEAVTKPGAGIDPATFTAKGLHNAVMGSVGKNDRVNLGSTGDIPGQRQAEAMVSVYGQRVPDSGTASRMLAEKALHFGGAPAAAAGASAMHALPAVLAASAAHALPYLPPVSRAISRTVVANAGNARNAAIRAALDAPGANNLLKMAANAKTYEAKPTDDGSTYVGEDGNVYKINPATGEYERVQ